jgi:hypothetical protein
MIRLLIFFILSVMATGGTSMAENLSTCSVDTVPIQILNKRGDNSATTLSAAGKYGFTGNPSFNAFITAVTEHLAAKLAQEKLCLNSAESQERSLVKFAYLYFTVPGDDQRLAAVRTLEALPSDVCRISSPWIDIIVEREPVPSVRAIVRFNERQLLADQAVLEGSRNVPSGVAMPLKQSEFEQYAFEYSDSTTRINPAKKPIEERLPPDLLWLFRRAWQSTRGPFSAEAYIAMEKAMTTGADGYTKIVIVLIDQCFSSEGVDVQYNNILDVADLTPLEQYKIVTPIR